MLWCLYKVRELNFECLVGSFQSQLLDNYQRTNAQRGVRPLPCVVAHGSPGLVTLRKAMDLSVHGGACPVMLLARLAFAQTHKLRRPLLRWYVFDLGV